MKKLLLAVVVVMAVGLVVGTFPSSSVAAPEPKKIDRATIIPSYDILHVYFKYEQLRDEMKRGEFEKKVDFDKRVEKLVKEKEEAIFIEIPGRLEYDVDKELFSFDTLGSVFPDSNLQVPLHEIVRLGDGYEASNAFGVKATIEKKSKTTFDIEVVNINSRSKFVKSYNFIPSFKCPPEKAQQIKPRLRLIGEFTPTLKGKDGFTLKDSYYHSHFPTLSEPYETKGARHTLFVRVKNFHFMHDTTGEVVKSFPYK